MAGFAVIGPLLGAAAGASGTLGTVGTILSLGSSLLGAFRSIQQGKSEAANYRAQAAQLRQNAGQQRAKGQREAIQERRRGDIAQSRAVAVNAAGGGALDKTGIDIIAALEDEKLYRAGVTEAEHENAAVDQEYQASSLDARAKAAKRAGVTSALGTVAGGVGSFFGKYGEATPPSSDPPPLPPRRPGYMLAGTSGGLSPYGGYYQSNYHRPGVSGGYR